MGGSWEGCLRTSSRLIGRLTPLLATLTMAGGASAEQMDQTITFSRQDLTLSRRGGYDVVELAGCGFTGEVGKPQLPEQVVTLALPSGARVVGLEIIGAESSELLERVVPLPVQAPRILPIPGMEPPPWHFTEPDASAYSRGGPYPSTVVEMVSGGRLGDNSLAGLEVRPVQFLPETGRLRFFNRIDVRLHYEIDQVPSHAAVAGRSIGPSARRLVANPDAVTPSRVTVGERDSRLDPGVYDYVVVTDPGYVASFQPLVDWKTRKGVPATTVTVDWIESIYEGVDTQSRIRSFIADAAAAWGASWFLLGGDTQVVPARRAYAMTSEAGGHADEDAIGCDLYYSDLDGTWDLDGDGIYGETTDGVDLYPDVFVGRASVRTNADVQAFVQKVLSYERVPEPGVGLDMLMAGEVLWTEPYTDSGLALNMIDRLYVPPRYDPITKLYETLGNESAGSVTAALNTGQGHFLHSGHAWFTVIGCGEGYLDRSGAAALTNGARQPIVYSIGCWPAAFDLENDTCIAESFMRNPNGGAVAFIGNSRYGWAAPGNPGFGYSERFMQGFYRTVYGETPGGLGAALAVAKAELVPLSRDENVYRWNQYELNLLGDPEMPIWTDEPTQLEVSYPETIAAGATSFDVSVWTSQGPVQGAVVCLQGAGGLYERATSGSDGGAVLPIQLTTPGDIDLTVTAPDCRPYEDIVAVSATGAYVRPSGVTVDDSQGGNGDGLAGPGETLTVGVTLGNLGSDPAAGVEAVLRTDDPMVQVISEEASYGDIEGGGIASPSTPFTLVVDEACPDRHVALLDLTVTTSESRTTWVAAVTLTIAAPMLTVQSYSLDDTAHGNGDGALEPGETVDVMLELRNEGLATATSVEAFLSTLDSYVTAEGTPRIVGDVQPEGSSYCVFTVSVSPSCPVPRFPNMKVDIDTSDGFTFSSTFGLSIGQNGMSDDFEGGASGWTHGGANDLWRTTTRRAHSGSTSWYSGSDETWSYQDGMDARLLSPEFVVGPGAVLHFWCWYEFPTYHEDGMYVELLSGGVPVDTLDFLGSGGALGQLGTIGSDWLEYGYGIERAVGETLQVRFRFVSDASEVAEGVYLDDIAVTSGAGPTDAGVTEHPQEWEAPAVLHQNRPNPFTPFTMIGFTMRAQGPVVLSIYNIQGRLIRTLLSDTMGPGDHSVLWDGRDELGVDVAAGVYMYRLAIGEFEDTRKMILIR